MLEKNTRGAVIGVRRCVSRRRATGAGETVFHERGGSAEYSGHFRFEDRSRSSHKQRRPFTSSRRKTSSSSGATNIPDLLRMVPGMDVAQINSNSWAISTRGFNGRFMRTELDRAGRWANSIYTAHVWRRVTGTCWTCLSENIDRIEVIRGPGGAVWGANAVNGVVNVITKKAGQTKGGHDCSRRWKCGPGVRDSAVRRVRRTSDRLSRLFEVCRVRASSRTLTSADGGDRWNVLRGGFRVDSAVSARTFADASKGDVYSRAGKIRIGITSSFC